jgi:type II secretory pathway component PulK
MRPMAGAIGVLAVVTVAMVVTVATTMAADSVIHARSGNRDNTRGNGSVIVAGAIATHPGLARRGRNPLRVE